MTNNLTSPSPYIAYYSMTREPFGEAIEDDLYYAEPLRKQRLEILLHLTQYSNELMLVIGPEGSGKTTLLQQYQRQALDNWAVAPITGGNAPDDRQFLQQLYRQMGLEFRGATQGEMTERMEQHFLSLQRNGRQAVMLVDDAHKLPVNTLKNVLAMARLINPEGKPLVRVILFATRELVQGLQNPHLGHYAAIAKRSIELPPFNLEQTTNYILHRLSAAQYSASTPFTDAVIARIHKRSNGWPGMINALARQTLLDSLPATPKPREPLENLPSPVRPKRVAALVITVIAIGALLIFQDEVNQWFVPSTPTATSKPIPLALPEPTATAPTPPPAAKTPQPEANAEAGIPGTEQTREAASTLATNTTPAEATEPDRSPGPVAVTPPLTPSIEMAQSPATPEKTEQAPTPPSSAPLEQAPPETVPPDKAAEAVVTPTPAVSPAPAPPPAVPDTASASVASASPSDLPARQNAWLRTQNPQSFTLQLVAGNNLDTLRRFIDEHDLHDNLAVYHSQRDGKPWHGLLYGVYSTKQAAIDARSQLPAALREAQPWIRDLDGIQKSLTQAP